MAKKGKVTNELALIPNATVINVEGIEVVVPTTKDENAMQAIILAAIQRALISRSIKKWITDEQWPSPQDLKNISAAIREINESCGAVFDKIELPVPQEKKAEMPEGAIDFSALEVKVEEKKDDDPAGKTG